MSLLHISPPRMTVAPTRVHQLPDEPAVRKRKIAAQKTPRKPESERRAALHEMMTRIGRPLSVMEIHEAYCHTEYPVSYNSVCRFLSRLLAEGKLVKRPAVYFVPEQK